MSQLTDRGPTLSSRGRASTQRSSALGTAFLGGVLAAGLGLGAFAVAVLLLWVASPYPDSDPSRALHLAADLWFLAHGSDLVRAVAASGGASPVAVTPLLLMALPLWLLYRSARHILESPGCGDTARRTEGRAGHKTDHRADHRANVQTDDQAGTQPPAQSAPWEHSHPDAEPTPHPALRPEPHPTLSPELHPDPRPTPHPALHSTPHPLTPDNFPPKPTHPPKPASPSLLHFEDIDPEPTPRLLLGWLLTGYLLVAGAALLYASSGPLHVEPLSALLYVPVVAVVTLAVAAWRTLGPAVFVPLPGPVRRAHDRLPAGLRASLEGRRLATAVSAGFAALLMLLLCGALLALLALGWHAPAVRSDFLALTHDWVGRCTVLLLSLVLLPNTVVWGVAYGLGPGFTLGAGSTVGPLAAAGYPELPHFPLFGMVPEAGATGPLHWLTAVVPLAVGAALARYAALSAKAYAAAARAGAPAGPDATPATRPAGVEWTGWRETAVAAGLAAFGCAGVTALLAGLAGGALGSSALARFGPNWWQTGLATLGWTVLLGVPGALVARAWWLRGVPRPPKPEREPREKLRKRMWGGAKRLTLAILRAAGQGAGAACRFCWTALRRTATTRTRREPRRRPRRPRLRPRRSPRHRRTAGSAEPYDYAYDRDYGTGPGLGHPLDHGHPYDDSRPHAPGHPQEHAPEHPHSLSSGSGFDHSSAPGLHTPPSTSWHDASTRRARWSALRASSGGLMTDFEPTAPPRAQTPGNASAAGPEGGG
ncbi:DUF6350 family protein [Streptomyces sp. NPDC018045]|uniref:cell division protein PerM n=1 Tax=Streptomyces sp. NPDC018045 TaxID=3365037 RepID=UPI0037A32CC3